MKKPFQLTPIAFAVRLLVAIIEEEAMLAKVN